MKPKTIMVVDDEEDIQRLLKKRLNHAGFNCVVCSTVEEGLEQIGTIRPDLVILDLGFKRASGIAFLQNMGQAFPLGTKPPVMVLSAYGDPEIVEHTQSLGVKTFLTKPFDSDKLLKAVGNYFH